MIALFAIAGDHLYEYSIDHYSAIPTIGALFLLNAIGGFGIGTALLIPIGKLVTRRRAELLTAALAIVGIGLAAGSLVGLFVSETTSLFGFMEAGYRTSIVIAIIAETAAIATLVALVVLGLRTHRRYPHPPVTIYDPITTGPGCRSGRGPVASWLCVAIGREANKAGTKSER